MSHRIQLLAILMILGVANMTTRADHALSSTVANCPFCSAVQQTITEQMADSDVVVIAQMVEKVELPPDSDELPKAVFEVAAVVKGLPDLIGIGDRFKTIYVGDYDVGQKVMVLGVQPPELSWTTPIKISDAAEEYLLKLPKLPKSGAERLRFFQQYLESAEPLLSFDAYEEFARASYAEVIELKPWMDHDQLLSWLKDPDVTTNRKRLYFTLLGVCGTDEDLQFLESMITSDLKEDRRGLDSMIACYLTLKGESGLDLIDTHFFENAECDYVDAFAAISAIRFHATEDDVLSRERILKSFHKVLKTPERADLVIPDLARWEDWSVVEEMVALFKNADEKSKWVRVPVVSYLQVCPKPEAKQAIEELTKLDPEVVRRAQALLNWESGGSGDEWDEDETESPAEAGSNTSEPTGVSPPVDPQDDCDDGDNADELRERHTSAHLRPQQEDAIDDSPDDEDGSRTVAVPVYHVNRLPVSNVQGDSTVDNATPSDPVGEYTSATEFSRPATTTANGDGSELADSPVVAAQAASISLTLGVMLLPFVAGGLLFLLLWSVINGWFERLIF